MKCFAGPIGFRPMGLLSRDMKISTSTCGSSCGGGPNGDADEDEDDDEVAVASGVAVDDAEADADAEADDDDAAAFEDPAEERLTTILLVLLVLSVVVGVLMLFVGLIYLQTRLLWFGQKFNRKVFDFNHSTFFLFSVV